MVAALSEISLVRTKPYGQTKAVVAVAFAVNLGFRRVSLYPVRFSRVAVLEVAAVAGWLEEIAGPRSSTVNWCLWLGRAPALRSALDLHSAGDAQCGARDL